MGVRCGQTAMPGRKLCRFHIASKPPRPRLIVGRRSMGGRRSFRSGDTGIGKIPIRRQAKGAGRHLPRSAVLVQFEKDLNLGLSNHS